MSLVCIRRLEPAQNLKAAHFRHDEIEQDEIEFPLRDKRQRRRAGRGGDHRVALPRQPALQHVAVGGIVVDDEDRARLHRLAQFAARRQRRHGAQHIGDDVELLGAAIGAVRAVTLLPRQRHHGVDLAEQLVGGFLELGEIRAQRMFAVGLHILDQQLAIALDGVERGAQVMPQPPVKRLRGLVLLAIRGRVADDAFDECVQLHAGAAHAVEVGEHGIELQPARILDDHVEKFGDGGRRRLHLLAQERRQGPIEALVRCGARHGCSVTPLESCYPFAAPIRRSILPMRRSSSTGLVS